MVKLIIGLLALVLTVSAARPAEAQSSTGCCFTEAGFCISDLTQAACDQSYTPPNTAGVNFYSGKTCSQVSVCAATGKCQKTDGTQCTDRQKWQCDDLYSQGYRFFQGQTCAVTPPSTGTCCVQNPTPPSTTPTCEENIDAATCTGARLGTFHSNSCYTVSNCPQALVPGTTPPPAAEKPPIIFDPEISIPFFETGKVDSTTFAKYIRSIFIAFIWSVGGLATVMVIYGGVRWVSAAGDPSRINQAKDVVYNAIIGLIIALTSVVLLNLIDPRLVNFQGLGTIDSEIVEPIPFESDNFIGLFNEGGEERPDPSDPSKTIGGCKSKGQLIAQESTCVLSGKPFVWPVGNVPKVIKDRVGPRDIKVKNATTCHVGTDFSTQQVTKKPILAPAAGKITSVTTGLGEYFVRLEGNGFYFVFVHIKEPAVKAGQMVQQGQLVGYSGGRPEDGAKQSGGPHLHLNFYTNDNKVHDPVPCLQF